VERDAGHGGRPSPAEWLSSDKHRDLLPTPWLTDAELEDFTEALLKAQPLLGATVRHVAHVERWGVPGDKQDGIDFFGRFNDQSPAAWQCKQLEKLRRSDVRAAVAALTFDGSDEQYLVYGRVATQQARDEIRNHATWTLLDRRDLTEMFRLLPTYAQRDIAERFWGPEIRRFFVEAPDDGFISLDTFTSGRLNPAAVVNDCGPLAGRQAELEALAAAMDRGSESFRQLVVVVGPNGRGKSRFTVTALMNHEDAAPATPVICLRAQRTLTPDALRELRPQPSIVFIDDAHRDPSALAPLLDMVRRTSDIQVVIATRPSALSAVREQIALALFGPDEHATVELTELALPDARALVKGVTDDLNLTFDIRNYLAAQATHSPHVAVIAANLIRRSQLTKSPKIDTNLREQVLARYQELLVPGDIEGQPATTTHRVIATYALLEPVEALDEVLRTRMAGFCGLEPHELARLERALLDRGVLIQSATGLRVVPDVLADRVGEMTAAVEGHDTGFVAELWAEFGADQHHRLAPALGDLDWRLARSGGPNVMAPVWEAIARRLETPYASRLVDELGQLEQLAASQPTKVIDALDILRERLNAEEDAGIQLPPDPDEEPYRAAFALRPPGRADVREKLPTLYTRAAANDPVLLERALDALWDLRRRDPRPTHSHPDHAARMVSDHLANLARLPDPSFPARVVARVASWTEQSVDVDGVTTPLFFLKPLLVKEELETVQSSFRKLEFRPHLISATAMRPIRDQIRTLLTKLAASENLRLAGSAVELLGEALHAPHGYFGQAIGEEAILQWRDDDLATLQALKTVAETTPSPVIRRYVRDAVSWNAEHATSLHVQQAAMKIVHTLDRRADTADRLADLVLHGDWDHSILTVARVPTLKELTAQRRAEKKRVKNFTEQEASDDRMVRIRAQIAERETRVAERNQQLAQQLAQFPDPADAFSLVDGICRAVLDVKPDRHIILWGLWSQVDALAPQLLGQLAEFIAQGDNGPLDNDLDLIVDLWMNRNPIGALAWVNHAMRSARPEVRRAIASCFARFAWHQRGTEFGALWSQGSMDSDESVAQAFLASSGGLLENNVVDAVETLLGSDISPGAATRALESACRYDGRTFGASLDSQAAAAALLLVARAGLGSHAVQQVVAGIATVHPELALGHLVDIAEKATGWQLVPDDIYGLREGFEAHPDAFVGWFIGRLDADSRIQRAVLSAALNEQLRDPIVDALVAAVPTLRGKQVQALVELLGVLTLWAVEHRRLAEALMKRARRTRVAQAVLEHIRDEGTHLAGWGWVNGVSEELNRAATQASHAAAYTTDEALQSAYENAHARFLSAIADIASEHARDEEQDW
jgi:hypothetical protein